MYTPQGKHTKLLYNEVRFCRAKKCANQRKNIKGTLKFRLLDRWVHTQKIIYWQQQQQAKKKIYRKYTQFFLFSQIFSGVVLVFFALFMVCVCVFAGIGRRQVIIFCGFFSVFISFMNTLLSIVVMGWY